jgi:hypothetical protein
MVSERVKVHIGLAAAVLVLIVCMVLILLGALHEGDLRAALPGSVAPDFTLQDSENHPVALSDLRGDIVIVYFHGQNTDTASSSSMVSQHAAAAAQPAAAGGTMASIEKPNRATSPVAFSAPAHATEIAQLSAMCLEWHNPRVKLLELETPQTETYPKRSPSDFIAPAKAVSTLIDSEGDVARKYRVDGRDARPTLFVIDSSGVIRYRGNSLESGAASFSSALSSPATQPSSCPRIVQALLSTEALSMRASATAHF